MLPMSSTGTLPFCLDLQERKLPARTLPENASPGCSVLTSASNLSKVPGTKTLRFAPRKPKSLLEHAGIRRRTAVRSSTSVPRRAYMSQTNKMFPRSNQYEGSESPKRNAKSAALSKNKTSLNENDWTDITDPEERRRMQNRIAQRKFRSKAKENKERNEREAQNQQHAGNSYRTPSADDFDNMNGSEPSGLPWGSVNFGFIAAHGHEHGSRRSSGRDTCAGDAHYHDGHDVNYHDAYQNNAYTRGTGSVSWSSDSVAYSQAGTAQTPSYGSPETVFYESPRQASYTCAPDQQQQYWSHGRW